MPWVYELIRTLFNWSKNDNTSLYLSLEKMSHISSKEFKIVNWQGLIQAKIEVGHQVWDSRVWGLPNSKSQGKKTEIIF